VSHLVREFVETAETLSRDLDFLHPATSNVVPETHPLALFSIPARTAKRLHQFIVFQDVEGLFEDSRSSGLKRTNEGRPLRVTRMRSC
jgi:hypothetical protein